MEQVNGLARRVEDGVLWIEIDRQEVGNSLTPDLHVHLTAWIQESSADPDVRAVVLSGAGDRFFCTGADLKASAAAAPPPGVARAHGDVSGAIQRSWQRTITALLDSTKPVIASVNGIAAGAGCHLAMACDLVVAADHARFVEVFVRRGIAPDAAGAYLLTRLIGPRRTKELMFFGDDLPAAQALEWGLVNRVVPGDDLAACTRAWAERLAAGPTRAIGMGKQLVNRALDDDRESAFWQEAWAQETISTTEDAKEGLAAFVEGRPTQFRGR